MLRWWAAITRPITDGWLKKKMSYISLWIKEWLLEWHIILIFTLFFLLMYILFVRRIDRGSNLTTRFAIFSLWFIAFFICIFWVTPDETFYWGLAHVVYYGREFFEWALMAFCAIIDSWVHFLPNFYEVLTDFIYYFWPSSPIVEQTNKWP